MNGTRLTTIAERAAQRYLMLLGALGAVFSHASQQPSPGSPRVKRQAVERAYEFAQTYLIEEVGHIEQMLQQTAEDAFEVTVPLIQKLDAGGSYANPEGDIEAQDHISEIATDLENALRVQLERDITSMTRGLRDMALRASLVGRARGIPAASALIVLQRNGTTAPAFTYVDRAGKRWASQKFVRTIWRQSLLLAWNEVAMLTIAGHGLSEAEIRHPDHTYAHLGDVISLDESLTGVTWDQVKDDLFHPNSNAWMSPHISDR